MKKVFLLFIFFALFLSTQYSWALEYQKAKLGTPHRKILHGQVDIIISSCNAAGVTLSSLKLPALVEKVRVGSPALYAGVAKGDKVLSAQLTNDLLCLVIERNGQKYYAQISTVGKLNRLRAKANETPSKPIKGQVQEANQKPKTLYDIFSTHDLILIVDRSLSMSATDCPGGLSRWQWCSQQSADLADAVAKTASSVSMSFFNDEYNVWRSVKPKDIPVLFDQHDPIGKTILAPPLHEQLDYYFHHSGRKRPVIVVVISDGMPQDSSDVVTVLQTAMHEMAYPKELSIIFLLVGGDLDEVELRQKFDEGNTSSLKNGEMFTVIPFPTAATKGIKQALLEELIARQVVDTSKTNKAGAGK